jgi:type I restriction enzyme R subunit
MSREDEVAETLTWTRKILERKNVQARVYGHVRDVIETFINGMRGF